MQDQSDKCFKKPSFDPDTKKDGRYAKYRTRARRRAAHIKNSALQGSGYQSGIQKSSALAPKLPQGFHGYDPELLYVECGRCGSPVIWEEGRAGRLLLEAGIDPLELDSSCILLTDGCPACGSAREYSVRIFRLSDQGATHIVPLHGHA